MRQLICTMIVMFSFSLFAQITFEWQAPITLQIPTVPLERISVTENRLLIRNEAEKVVHMLDWKGKLITNLGGEGSGAEIAVPFQVTWIPEKSQFLVYDAGYRNFLAWSLEGKYLETKKTELDYFFEVGTLLPVNDGYIAPISLTQGRYLVGKYNSEFKPMKFEHELVDLSLAEMSPSLRQTFVIKVHSSSGPLILAIQKLAKNVYVYDTDLNFVRSLTLNTKGWKNTKYKRLEKVSKNPKALSRYQQFYSDIGGMEGLYDSIFIVGIRNLQDYSTYTYQCYDAANGLPISTPFDSSYLLVGAWKEMLWFVDPAADQMALIPCRIGH